MSDAGLHIAILHGPNLNLLGTREPETYGDLTLDELNALLRDDAAAAGVELTLEQHNLEGAYVEAIQAAKRSGVAGLVLNPAAFTHTSVAIRDALLAVSLPAVEVHMSNVYAREAFRHHSMIADVVVGRVVGFGARSYRLGLQGLIEHLRRPQ